MYLQYLVLRVPPVLPGSHRYPLRECRNFLTIFPGVRPAKNVGDSRGNIQAAISDAGVFTGIR